MTDLLTNAEIDALLAVFRAEGVAAAETTAAMLRDVNAPAAVVSEVDLLKPNRFSREHMRSFERIGESIGNGLAAAMSDRLRLDMLCDCVAVEQMRFSSWLSLVGSANAIYVLKMPPFESPVLLGITSGLLYGAVDRVLGGSGRVQDAGREFTAAEYTVAEAFVGPCLDRIAKGLEELGQFSWSIEDQFANPLLAQIYPSQDVVLSLHFQASSDSLLGDLRLALPFAALAPFLHNVNTTPGMAKRLTPGSLRDTTSRTVRGVPMSFGVVLGSTQVPLRQLMTLRVGDVLPLPTRLGQPLVAPVQGKPKFLGQVGVRGSHLAFQIGAVVS